MMGIPIIDPILAASMMAVSCGTPTPATMRVVQMEPGPTPTFTAPDQDNDNQPGITSFITTSGTSTACGGDPYAALPDPNNPLGTPRA